MMTIHKLTAGDGYTYLTRQVASADEERSTGQSLVDYYTARGNPAGRWLGGGASVLGVAGTAVEESQMRALFADGSHPNRDSMLAAGIDEKHTKLGSTYRFTDRKPVAGYDLVFTPVKSVSVLWALGGLEIRKAVEDAHDEALANTLAWIEKHAAFTRTGHAGVAQIDTTGLVAAAFDHRDSRCGDPDLHTHVAVANKVQGLDGKWRSLDARVLHSLAVAASERYNTRLEDGLHRRLGVAFVERSGAVAGKRPVREVVGVPGRLLKHFSKRRAAIEERYGELLADYRSEHHRDPSRVAQKQLAQQATLETREGKAPGRTLAEQIADWTTQAETVIGTAGIEKMHTAALNHPTDKVTLDDPQRDDIARHVVFVVSEGRSTWTRWNAYAEAERAMRSLRFASSHDRDSAVEQVVAIATSSHHAIRIIEPELIAEPDALTRGSDGQSVYLVHGGERYTTASILQAEDLLVAAAVTKGQATDPLVAEAAIAVHESQGGVQLDPGQRALVSYLATYPAVVAVGIGPAGAGKTTAMQAYAAVLAADGRRLVPLATSAKSAQVLGSELGMRADNVHKFLHEHQNGPDREVDPWFTLQHGDVVLVDEAGMAGTLQLAQLVTLARTRGATVRLVGDPAQLASVDAGGALRLLESEVGAAHLDHLHRFADPDEAAATLQLRDGNPEALAFYLTHKRVEHGSREAMTDAAYDAWSSDVVAGLTSVLIAANSEDIRALNARARRERVSRGEVEPAGITLHDDNLAGIGDWIITRANLRGLTCHHGRDWVKNGDRWEVQSRHADGAITVRHLGHRGTARLPADYVAESVELAYAVTAHRTQGTTVDTAHALVTEESTRESLYVSSTRGTLCNRWYVATEELLSVASDHQPRPPMPPNEMLTDVLQRSGAELSATTTIRDTQREATRLPVLVSRYHHAWDLAARAALSNVAPIALPRDLARRVLDDPASTHLARVLADTAARGADPSAVLRAAASYDDLNNVRSPALVIASRIEDFPTHLGIPRSEADGPLPWLCAPRVGHPDWDSYLAGRADLIRSRAEELGSISDSYRELYSLHHLPVGDLGPPPERGSTQRRAYEFARREQDSRIGHPSKPHRRTAPSDVRQQQRRDPRLTR